MEKLELIWVLIIAVAVGFVVLKVSRLLYFKYLKFKRTKRLIKFTRHKRFWVIGFISTLLAIPIIAYICNFKSIPISGSAEHWGQMGDFFGGLLNPVLAFASFMALLYTIRIQSEELRLTRDELSKSAVAAQKSADLQEKNVEQQKLNVERQFAIARYQELMALAREKLNKINGVVFDSYTYLDDDGSGGENPLREAHAQPMAKWFEWQLSCARFQQEEQGKKQLTLKDVQSQISRHWSDYGSRADQLNAMRRNLILLGFILRDLEFISMDDVNHIRSDIQFSIGVLLCASLITYKDPALSAINSDVGCPFNGFLDAHRIKLDISPQ